MTARVVSHVWNRTLHGRTAGASFSAPASAAAALWWTLRVGAFLCFVGHGAFGIITKEAWVPFFAVAGIGRATAFHLMPFIGIVDVLVGTLTLVQPRAAVTAYLVLWALWTAALRPLSGQPVWELLERAGNYGVPFALLLLTAVPARGRAWRAWVAPATMRPLTPPLLRQVRLTLAVTTALLLLGHGVLSLQHKPELVAHYAVLLPAHGAMLAGIFGGVEVGLAVLVLWRPSVAVGLAVCGWKLATESLFLAAGAPIWEVVERGGSYAAPLALALAAWQVRHLSRNARSLVGHG